MRLSKAGLVISSIYVVLAIASGLFGNAQADVDVSTFFMQVPLIPAFGVVFALDAVEWTANISWLVAYAIYIPATAVVIYGVVWVFGAASVRVRLAVIVALLVTSGVVTMWPRPHL